MHLGKKLLFVLAAAIVASAGIAGTLATSSGKAAQKATKVALVTDIGSLNDKGFNSLSAVGLKQAENQLGVEGRIYITQTAADRQPNLTAAAQAGYPLVIAVGVLFAFGPLPTVAGAFPTTMFAGVDVAQGDMCGGKPVPASCVNGAIKNVHGIQFAEQEAGCLVGNVAALEMLREHRTTISAVGAIPVPAIVRYIAGYKYCAKRVSKKIKVLVNYANDSTFADQTKCKATALAQIARGSHAVFQVAGQCGLGALDAAKGRGVWGIGVDADQYFLGRHMLTSALKRVNTAVFDTIKAFNANPTGFKGGDEKLYNLKNGGVGYGRLSPKLPVAARAAITKSTNNLEKLIIQGKVKPPKA
jgi:basic membrane protein A and related proteins